MQQSNTINGKRPPKYTYFYGKCFARTVPEMHFNETLTKFPVFWGVIDSGSGASLSLLTYSPAPSANCIMVLFKRHKYIPFL